MSTFSYSKRLLLGLLIVVAITAATAPLLFFHWASAIPVLLLDLGIVFFVWRQLSKHVEEQHRHFIDALRDLRNSVGTGKQSMLLKSDRPPDSFGTIADEINLLILEATEQISGQLRINRDLQQNKTLFQSILGTMIEGVLVLDADRNVLYFNEAARRVLGCTDRHVEGRPIWEVLRASDLNETIDAVYESGAEFRKELELKRSKSIVEITAVRLPIPPRPGVVVVLHEVTELRSMERMRREFVSNVSHELKTPLTSIQVYAETLLDGGLEDLENNRKFVGSILDQSDRLQGLIQDMLRLAKIETQSEAFQLRPVQVSKVLETCVDQRLAVARSRQLELNLRSGGANVEVMADPGGLQAIFDNLVSNSLNYSRPGGHVDVSWSANSQEVAIEVKDDGIGIAREHHERIFERFYRADKSRLRGVGGNGLGLSIVKHLTAVFHGRIELKSEPGQGSTFRVILPVVAQSSQSLSGSIPNVTAHPKTHDAF